MARLRGHKKTCGIDNAGECSDVMFKATRFKINHFSIILLAYNGLHQKTCWLTCMAFCHFRIKEWHCSLCWRQKMQKNWGILFNSSITQTLQSPDRWPSNHEEWGHQIGYWCPGSKKLGAWDPNDKMRPCWEGMWSERDLRAEGKNPWDRVPRIAPTMKEWDTGEMAGIRSHKLPLKKGALLWGLGSREGPKVRILSPAWRNRLLEGSRD